MDTSALTPDIFKQQVVAANPNAVDSKGVKYADIPSDELLTRFIQKSPTAITSNGIPYTAYMKKGVDAYAASSANPAVSGTNLTPSQFQKIMSGTPLAPVSATNVGGQNKEGQPTPGSVGAFVEPIALAGKMLANVFSDAPAVLSAIPQAILHPINTVDGLVTAIGNITKTTGDAIGTGIATGDWSKLADATQEAEISAANHPLQTVLLMDGALSASKSVIQGVADKGLIGSTDDMATKTATSALSDINKAKANIAKLFNSKTTLMEHTALLEKGIDESIDAHKNLTTAQETVDSMTAKNKAESLKVGELQTKTHQKIDENQQAKQSLDIAKLKAQEVDLNNKIEVQKGTSDQQQEMSLKNGFDGNLQKMGQAVAGLFKTAKERLSGIYDAKLGDAPVDLSKVFDAAEKAKDDLYRSSDPKTAKALGDKIDELKIRDIVTKNKNASPQDLYKALNDSGINPKLWQDLNFDEIKRKFPELTSKDLKQTKANVEGVIKESNERALKSYNENIESAFKDVFENAIKNSYGKETLDEIKQNDANWSKLRSNPLSSDSSPTLSEIQKNWNSFVDTASKVNGGDTLISRIQNFTGEKILNDAKNKLTGEYDPKKIATGLDKYKSILDDVTKSRLQKVLEDNQYIQDKSTAIKTALSEIQKSVVDQSKELSTKKKTLDQQQSEIESTANKIGADAPDIVNNIKKINSPEKLQAFLGATGVKVEDLGPAVISSIFKEADVDIGLNRLDPVTDKSGNPVLDSNGKQVMKAPNFDISKIKNALKEVRKVGGGNQDVQDIILGQTDEMKSKGETSGTQKSLIKLEEQVKEYDSIKSTKGKTIAQRLANIAVGTLMLTLVPIGKFFAMRRIYEGIRPAADVALEDARSRTNPPTEDEKSATAKSKDTTSKKRLQAGIIAKQGLSENDQNQ